MSYGEKASLLIVDNDVKDCEELTEYLREKGYQVASAFTYEDAIKIINDTPVDLVLSDLKIPGMKGIRLLRVIKEKNSLIEVIMMTTYATLEDVIECIRNGAADFIVKPFFLDFIEYSINRALKKQKRIIAGKKYQSFLVKQVRDRTEALVEKNEAIKDLYLHTIKALAFSLEARDKNTEDHSLRVTTYALELALRLKLTDKEREDIEIASLLHDIGRIGVSENILDKPEKLSEEEYKSVQKHPVIAEHILSPIKELKGVLTLIRHHHERFDGKGYPDGLKGDEIPLGARVLAVCDTYDAMLSSRPYRKAFSKTQAREEIKKNSGTQFDPEIVDMFMNILEKKEKHGL